MVLANCAFAQPAENAGRHAETISRNWGTGLSPEEVRNRAFTLDIVEKSGFQVKGSLSGASLSAANGLYEKLDFNFANAATLQSLIENGYLMVNDKGDLTPQSVERLQTFAQYNYAIYSTKKINQGWQNYIEQRKAGKAGYNEWMELRDVCMPDKNHQLTCFNNTYGGKDTMIDGKRHVLMVSWKKDDFVNNYIKTTNGVKAHTSYNKFFEYPLFLTTAYDMQNAVQRFNMGNMTPEQIDVRMMQLLGLPPGSTNTKFVEFWVKEEDLFRPMIDSLVQQSFLPYKANSNYYQALGNYMTGSYKDDKLFAEFPFLGLGYTYDWCPTNTTHAGVTEFVLKENRVARVRSITSTKEYIDAYSPQRERERMRQDAAGREGGR